MKQEISQVINGTNLIATELPTGEGLALTALNDFYYAFNQRNLECMEANWLQTDAASMSNPLGDIKRGWQAIRPVYEKLFNGPAQVYVEFYDVSIDETDNMFCAVGRERGWFQTDQQRIDLTIRTSRIYQKHDGVWQQLHHHGSIEKPDLLDYYQSIILKTNTQIKEKIK